MSRTPRLSCAAIALVAAAFVSPVQARTIFSVQTDNWFVISLTNSCIAFNRPPNEYNHSPYNSLTVHAPKGGGILIEGMFWPGLLEKGKPYKLLIRAEGGDRYEIEAERVDDMTLKSREPVPDDLVKELRKAKLVTVGASRTPISLGFDTTRFNDILAQLESCRGLIAKD